LQKAGSKAARLPDGQRRQMMESGSPVAVRVHKIGMARVVEGATILAARLP
jgi:hypothetical protein